MQIGKIIGALGLLVFLSGCGKSGIVQNIDVQSKVDANNEQVVALQAYLNLGGLRLPALTIPIGDPNRIGTQIGSLTLSTTLEGHNVISLEANASKILKGQIGQDGRLPNGNAIPVAGAGGVAVINLSGVSRLYLGAGEKPFLGFALVIPEFDQLGKYVPGFNLFLPLADNLGVNGLAGVFSGGPSQNGIGLFVEVPGAGTPASPSPQNLRLAKADTNDLQFVATDEKSSKSQKLESVLGKMSQKKTQLRVR